MITCEVCGEKPAKVHVTQIKNNKKITIHMCQDCARKQAGSDVVSKLSIADFLQGMFKQEAGAAAPPTQDEMLTCPGCGQTYRAFKESGKLGCADCYDTFEKQLVPLLRRVHKSERHVGKRPRENRPATVQEQLAQLRRHLEQAVAREEFERAASLRDEIRRLDNEGQKKD